MTGLQAILIAIVFLVLAFAVQVAVLVYGWGLEPANWWVISCGFLFSLLLTIAGKQK